MDKQKRYIDYDLSDFLDDDSFVTWVKDPYRSDLIYWDAIANSLPEKKEIIKKAKLVVLSLSCSSNISTEERKIQIWGSINQTIVQSDHNLVELIPRQSSNRIWPKLMGIAASVALIIIVGYWYKIQLKKVKNEKIASAIVPGKLGATLTLANGKKILLADAANGKLAEQGMLIVSKTDDGLLTYTISSTETHADHEEENKLSTANGQTYSVILPDKSKVWLNATSTITYSSSLIKDGKRKVALEGEAYFEVAKDAKHPFIVQSHNQQIEVLGTHFNVNAYPDEAVAITSLLEGAVKLTAGRNVKVLEPGQEGRSEGGYLTVHDVDVANAIDWKDGDFCLNRMNFKTAMRKIARWYNVKVVYEDSIPDDMESGGWISRDKPLAAVLKSIESAGMAKFKIEGRIIHVSQ